MKVSGESCPITLAKSFCVLLSAFGSSCMLVAKAAWMARKAETCSGSMAKPPATTRFTAVVARASTFASSVNLVSGDLARRWAATLRLKSPISCASRWSEGLPGTWFIRPHAGAAGNLNPP